MLKFNKEDTKQEKLIIIGLWIIALYFTVGSLAAISISIFTMQANGITEGFGILLLILGIGLLLEKGWALQVTVALSFMLILTTLAVFFSYLDGRSLELDESIETLVMLLLSLSCHFIVIHPVSMKIYEVDFISLNRVKSILYWTAGVGFLGFGVSLLYMTMYVDGAYRGLVVAYVTIFFIGLGFVIGILKAVFIKKK